MIKKITILLFFAIAILPATFNKVQAQNYGVESPGGDPDEPTGVTPVGTNTEIPFWFRDPEDETDPANDPDWGYPDWAELEDYLNYLNEMIGDPYSYDNTWGGTYDSTGIRYYITVDSKPEKHYDGSRISAAKKNSNSAKIKLTLEMEGIGTLQEAGLRWKVNGVLKSSDSKYILFPINAKGDFNVEVWEESIRKYIQFKVSVFGSPVVFFQKRDNYDGDYGFDDEGFRYDSLKNDYQKILVDSLNYNVPWMSLLDSQTATIKISPVITPEAASDTTTWVEFRVSASGKIKINGNITPIRKRGSELSSFNTINISGNKLDTSLSHYPQDSIVVVSNSGDTIGKLMISCLKPQIRRVVLVYVNTGSGYRNYTRTGFTDTMNTRSQNQIFRSWQLINSDTLHILDVSHVPTATTILGMDTLDLSTEFLADTAKFMDADRMLEYIDTAFTNHKGIEMKYDINYPSGDLKESVNKIHFVFMMNYQLPRIAGSQTNGITRFGGYKSIMWSNAYWQTITHEMGHFMALNHTFPEEISPGVFRQRYGIPKYTTTNFMDYYYTGFDNSDMFFYRQWKTAY